MSTCFGIYDTIFLIIGVGSRTSKSSWSRSRVFRMQGVGVGFFFYPTPQPCLKCLHLCVLFIESNVIRRRNAVEFADEHTNHYCSSCISVDPSYCYMIYIHLFLAPAILMSMCRWYLWLMSPLAKSLTLCRDERSHFLTSTEPLRLNISCLVSSAFFMSLQANTKWAPEEKIPCNITFSEHFQG